MSNNPAIKQIIKYIDQYLYETGNPDLNPQFTDNIEDESNQSYQEANLKFKKIFLDK